MRRSTREKSHNTASTSGDKDDEEIDYNITFPACGGEEDSKEPVVYLLGWWAASDKTLAKYCNIYEKLGCVTIRYVYLKNSADAISKMEHDQIIKYGEKLGQLLEDYGLSSNPVLIHCFSNGGSTIYYGLLNSLLQNNCTVIGTVLDSGPSQETFSVMVKALYTSMNSNFLLFALSAMAAVSQSMYIRVKSLLGWPHVSAFDYISTNKDLKWPFLVLFSSSDLVVPVDHVEDVVEKRALSSAFVRKYDFLTSGHVQHFKDHKEAYEKLCQEFIEDCLALYDGDDLQTILKEREESKESSVDLPNNDNNKPSSSTSLKSYL